MSKGNFNIRVYGLNITDDNKVLLSDEFVMETKMTKFPGGGLHFGEGPENCLRREAIEEFGQEIEITNHFYTTHYYQPAMFFKNTQLICIYYLFRFKETITFKLSKVPFDFPENTEGSQSFRYESIEKLSKNDLSFPIDQYVLKLLKEKYR